MQIWIIGAILAGLLSLFGGVQTLRLNHAKDDLTAARAAQVDPATKMKWQAEYELAELNLATCKGNVQTTQDALNSQNAALEAAAAAVAQRDAAIASARQAAKKAAAATQAAGETLQHATAKGADVCARLQDADRQVKEMLR